MEKNTYKDVMDLNAIVGRATNKGLPVESIIKLVDLKEELTAALETYQKAFKEIMGEFDVVEKDGVFDWSAKENAAEISAKVTDLINLEVEVKNTNFLEGDTYVNICTGLSISEMEYVKKKLKKA